MKQHHYTIQVSWTGNLGEGTKTYSSYKRQHVISLEGKPDISGSSTPIYRGDADRYNPEDLLVASVSSCHMLWYLHLCASAGVVVTAYEDHAEGIMVEAPDGSGHFTEVTLKPVITLADGSMIAKADALHAQTNKLCFIANSVNFPIHHRPEYRTV